MLTSTVGGGYRVVLGVRVSCKGRLRECDHQLQLLEELSVEKGIIFPLLFILVDKVWEQVLEWASPFKYDLVPSPGEQDGHAALSHLLFLFV